MIIKRDYYLKQLIDKKGNGRVKIIIGIRRCDKSYLLFNLYKDYLLANKINDDQIITIVLDNIENLKYRNPFELNDYIKSKIKNKDQMYYIFIDEIQLCEAVANPYVQSKEKSVTFVDVLLALIKSNNLDVYVTGSNSRMLSSDVLTQFRDRGDQIHINPLSFKEVYDLYENKELAFEHCSLYGGMPYIYSLSTHQEKNKYLSTLFNETYIKDVLERNNIKNEKEILELLLDFVYSSVGSLINPAKLSRRFLSERQMKISSNTILKYLSFFEEAYVLYKANRYDVKGSRYFSTPYKYYFADVGLRNARLNFRQIEDNHIMENIIYNDLVSRGYNVDIGVVEYDSKKDNTRTKIQLEIDFVVNLGSQRYYIQLALNVDTKEKLDQEIASLKRVNDSFKKIVIVKKKIIPRYDNNGILYIGIEDFLLTKSLSDL
ncbi:ATPase [Ureaplasma diversum]|uniref:ATPase n=1 Tax=Ureaplasma diversum TaxID=42094 RepID=A0A0C5RMA1_9BACT|nr:ATP-binding protein [Ureaplasma diversum]AJQ45547.1 ATPase [Ureaplasma diversum]